eukprot:CAMPEP_0178908654 /NCGR_PEP_ID=MMETSP0786-20121207/8044_1 /TAXON_ID=186022 /ORGANISM="Thalassionema frauenfeldii, Strain CCMP 1798" /LENGTH=186 /DNA_ID=CAMNT_0020580583 /DNA_START=168 /DNA_END=725 /DNA_ORIENTATION=+
MKHATNDTLLVYSHREETSRLISAIKHSVELRVCKKDQPGITFVGNECQLKEKVLINAIRRKQSEIGIGSTQLLTCEAYECIKDNSPNLVFMHFKQASKLQKLLAKHHCPEVTKEIRTNAGSEKKPVSVVLENNGDLVSLDDWLNAKSQMVELALDLKKDVSCQATTRDIEHELLACSSETLQISG